MKSKLRCCMQQPIPVYRRGWTRSGLHTRCWSARVRWTRSRGMRADNAGVATSFRRKRATCSAGGDRGPHRQKNLGARSKNGFDVGLQEIIADVEQPAGMLLRHLIGEAIAKI